MSKRGGLERGLRKRATDVRLHDEHTARISEAAQSHAMALEALREWHQRRIEQALRKCSDKPLARQGLEKILPIAKRVPLRPETVKFLTVAERCLEAGVDIEERPQKQRQGWVPTKRPDWMLDPALLPKRPPGK